MKRYKTFLYRGVQYYSELDRHLNDLARDGWEAFSIIPGLQHLQGDWFWVTCKKEEEDVNE